MQTEALLADGISAAEIPELNALIDSIFDLLSGADGLLPTLLGSLVFKRKVGKAKAAGLLDLGGLGTFLGLVGDIQRLLTELGAILQELLKSSNGGKSCIRLLFTVYSQKTNRTVNSCSERYQS